jgi:hypothetical protein
MSQNYKPQNIGFPANCFRTGPVDNGGIPGFVFRNLESEELLHSVERGSAIVITTRPPVGVSSNLYMKKPEPSKAPLAFARSRLGTL